VVSNYWCEVWLSSMLYLPLFIFFLQDVHEWNQIIVVRSSKIASEKKTRRKRQTCLPGPRITLRRRQDSNPVCWLRASSTSQQPARASADISHICIYDKSFSFWQNTCALLAFHLLRCTDPLFFLDGNFWLKLLLTGCNLCCSCHDFKKEAWGTNKHYAEDNGKQ